MMKLLAAAGLAALTCACASDPGPGPGHGPDGPPPMGPQLFVSPFGEPFSAEPGQPYPSAVWFARADADADGRLSRDEFQADGVRAFALFDVNRDGVIGPDENAAYETTMTRLLAGQGPGGRPGGPGRGGRPAGGPPDAGPRANLAGGQDDAGSYILPRRAHKGGPMAATVSSLSMANFLNIPQPIKAADTDTNQRITAEEWTRVGDRWFALLDTDRDGFLTMAELPQTALQRRGARGR